MAQPVIQPSFAAGELSPSLYGRVDLAKFHVGASLMRNFYADYRGGASNRAGTAYVGPCTDAINRLIPFTFSTIQTYALVFGDKKMRVVMDGAYVLEPSVSVVTVPPLNPAVVGFTDIVSWQPGDLVFVDGIVTAPLDESGLEPSELDGGFFFIREVQPGIGATLNDLNGNPVDGTAFAPYAHGGTVSRVVTVPTPYAMADLALLKFTQSADTMTICHPNYAPQQLTRTSHTSWTITPANFLPTAASPGGMSATPNQFGDGTTYNYVVTAVMANGQESLPSPVASAVNSKTLSLTSGANVRVGWSTVAGAVNYNVYRQAEVAGGAPDANQLYGFVGATSGNATSFVDANISPDFSRTPPQNYNPFAGGNNPGCTSYYQGRQVFAGSNLLPQNFWLSKSADFLNFGFSTPARPNDSISETIAAQRVNAIKHIVPMDAMILLSSDGAWKVDAGQLGGAVTPASIEAVPQSYNGASDVPPITINQDILYVQAKGSIVRDLAYNFYVKIYTGSDLTALSNHLFFGHQILEWAWSEEPYKIIWCVREDGELLTFTYLKEQDVYAWAHSDTQGVFKSVCSISEGQENAVYFVVSRFVKGRWVQYVERMASRVIGSVPEQNVPADFSKFWFVDCGLQSDLTTFQATAFPQAVNADPSIVGATVVAGGANYTSRQQIAESVVSTGPQINVTDPTGSGAQLVATVSGGVITGASALNPGANYTNPKLSVTDPTGSGAILSPVVSRDVEVRADADVFTAVKVGDLFIGGGGYGHVRRINNGRSITLNLVQPFANTNPIAPGEWSCTTPISKVFGLGHLEGLTVAILADGAVLEPQVVSNGRIVLDTPAAAITVGLPYVSQLRSLPLDIPGEATVQGKRKTISAVTVRQADSRGLKVGPDFDNLEAFKERSTEPMGVAVAAYTGDRRVVVPANYNTAGYVCVQQDNPLPATVLAIMPEITIGDS